MKTETLDPLPKAIKTQKPSTLYPTDHETA
jgi:hypothetical protein